MCTISKVVISTPYDVYVRKIYTHIHTHTEFVYASIGQILIWIRMEWGIWAVEWKRQMQHLQSNWWNKLDFVQLVYILNVSWIYTWMGVDEGETEKRWKPIYGENVETHPAMTIIIIFGKTFSNRRWMELVHFDLEN